jgi:malate synthase
MLRTLTFKHPVFRLSSLLTSQLQQQRLGTLIPRKNVNITHSPILEAQEHLFSEDFLLFLRRLSGDFQPEYRRVLQKRKKWLEDRLAGKPLNFREDTAWIRHGPNWRGPPIVKELEKRWVEITGPAGDAKMMINALNSGANGYMADLEDSQSPDWYGIMQGHQNLYDTVHDQLRYEKRDAKGQVIQQYSVNSNSAAALHVRVRGIHMYERHVIDESGRPMPGSLFDIATYLYHNAHVLRAKNIAPLLYAPKLESFEEAILIHDIIKQVETKVGLPYGTTRVTALIETLPGILQAEEIGYGLGPYWAGLNCGRWDYIFSVLKSQANGKYSFPDRALLTMDMPFLTSYMQRIVQVCHNRGVHAMGGMSAFIPSKNEQENVKIFDKVVKDKQLEIFHGCDGAWVAHPGMVKGIQEVFEQSLNGVANQITSKKSMESRHSSEDFIIIPPTKRDPLYYTENGLRTNISVGIQYLASWLDGTGAVAINGLMEDMATAEISRTQVWQWLHNKQLVTFADGVPRPLDRKSFDSIYQSVLEGLLDGAGDNVDRRSKLEQAAGLFQSLVTTETLQPFVQDQGYDLLNANVPKPEHLKRRFVAYQPPRQEIEKLSGSRPELMLDAKLSIARGEYFQEKMFAIRGDGLVAHGSFIGTPNGHSARNVVEGGLGYSWPYVGGWELNARGLVGLEQPMPDTLSVNFYEQGDCARMINNFLDVADKVQHLELQEKLNQFKKLPTKAEQDQAKIDLMASQINYLTQPMLADLEQGWGDPKKVFYAVVRCLQHGVNLMHIEDQYSLKRCGHLGGKGLDDINGWVITMKAANLAASIFEGVHRDGPKQNVNFVARTDALSAEFIQYSHHMHDASHPDHFFIDWDRGFTNDGRYLYLKKGINPKTGRKYGLEHSARRCAEIVKLGLASHVWMETPDAKIQDARDFMKLVNEHLTQYGVFARGLYNHSPSFVWDVNFFIDSQSLAMGVADYIAKDIQGPLDNKDISLNKAQFMVKQYLKDEGDRVRGDYNFSDDYVAQILANGLDLVRGEKDWKAAIEDQIRLLKTLGPSLQTYKVSEIRRMRIDDVVILMSIFDIVKIL